MSNRAWMPLHIADYLSDTGHLSAAEHGAYLLMIMHYWQNGRLPESERLIARIAKMDAGQWGESRDVLAMLFSDGWRHKRIDAELAKADEIIGKRRAAADARHSKDKADASAVQVHSTSSDTGALPSTKNQEKEEANASSKKRACRIPDDFAPDLEWAAAQGMSLSQAQAESAKFRDYWAGKGANATKTDWPATWRNWVRSAVEKLPNARGSPAGHRPNPLADAFGRMGHQTRNQDDHSEAFADVVRYLPSAGRGG